MTGIAISSARNQHQVKSPFEQCLDALGEVRDENVYSAIERLVQAGEQVGISVHDLIRMLGGGMNLETLLDIIEVRMTGTVLHTESRPLEIPEQFMPTVSSR